jgi:8-oxo-dGTP diphosphatase
VQGGKILVCQRTRHQTMPMKWEFPGGKIEEGEQPRDALRRELEEELGIDAIIGDEIARIKHEYKGGSSVELRFYLVREFRREIENRIFRDMQWAQPKDLPSFDFLEADLTLVADLASGNYPENESGRIVFAPAVLHRWNRFSWSCCALTLAGHRRCHRVVTPGASRDARHLSDRRACGGSRAAPTAP